MDTKLIARLLKSFKCFKGVYSSDMIPYFKDLPVNFIVNTDPSYKPGEHWVVISIDKTGHGIYFDSFGLPPMKEDIFNFLEKKCTKGGDTIKYHYNLLLQIPVDIIVCCILFLYAKA